MLTKMKRNKLGQFAGSLLTKIRKVIAWTLRIATASVVGAVLVVVFTQFHIVKAKEVVTEIVEVEKVVLVQDDTIPPILKKIAVCESNNSHYDKNGQVLINKTQDAGRYQINIPVWGKKAKEIGLNLMDEKDNETMAKWIFLNYGSAPWVASSNCWNK